ncbi:MAG TPA: peptidoglycan DD-metalloendopeptidase family protein [Pyrinomonadaceae bacterium]|nr:peptidoglycan DD-metalloendopeptidase family protein [Pyrinomonadaceae bacterium]
MALDVTRRARLRVVIIVVLVFGGLAVFLWIRARQTRTLRAATSAPLGGVEPVPAVTSWPAGVSESPALPEPSAPTPAASPSLESPSPADTPPPQDDLALAKPLPLSGSFVGTLKLIIPVAGVRPDQLLDTFADARSEGRVHDAIDIPAPAGTPVLATADGEIIKLFQSERGGTTIYQLSTDRKLVFYYAHLQRYADGITPGKFVKQGEVIAYVGDTGNAGIGNFHLHFSISVVADPKRYWEGTTINPYPLLRN